MTVGVASERPLVAPRARRWLLGAAGLVGVAALVPPVGSWARHYEVGDAVQFSLLALVVPMLLTLGAPWAYLGLSAPADRLAAARRRHPQLARALLFVVPYLLAFVLWRTPGAVGAVARNRWLLVPEAVSMVALGVGVCLEVVDSPPLLPRVARPWRAVLAAGTMWVVWTLAYVVGFSTSSWYPAFHHVAGRGISAAVDQQFATVVLWAAAGLVFVPVIFVDVTLWLRSEDDPDHEMQQLLKSERPHRWASPQPLGRPDGPAPPPA